MVGGSIVVGKVLSGTDEEIVYELENEGIRDTLTIPTREIVKIQYSNGMEQEFDGIASQDEGIVEQDSLNGLELYYIGKEHAKIDARRNNGVEIGGTVAASTCLGVLGMAGAVIYACTPPKPESMKDVSHRELLAKQDYYDGYKKQRWNLKARNVAIGVGIPIVVGVGLVVTVFALSVQ